ncbi:hypothetical protein Nmel_015442 [Mimus melanotis]
MWKLKYTDAITVVLPRISSNTLLRQLHILQKFTEYARLIGTTVGHIWSSFPAQAMVIEHMAHDCTRWFLTISSEGDSTPLWAICSRAQSIFAHSFFRKGIGNAQRIIHAFEIYSHC